MAFVWQWKLFNQLSLNDLYEIMKVRQQVFVLEQNCLYQDIDDLDKKAWHLTCWPNYDLNQAQLVAYLRVVYPQHKYKEPAMGRVLVIEEYRGMGLGKELLKQALVKIQRQYPHHAIRISAQQHLHQFYAQAGFSQVSRPYEEDGIMHIEMQKHATT
ncbi:MAG: GNAT family N-acetyltransferase [Thiotrichaceae bacterium]|nr:GNAT family N-acetyltransferase [Thiotrichaceae bacterium]